MQLCLDCEGSFYGFSALNRVFRSSEGQVRKTHLGISLQDESREVDLDLPVDCPECGVRMERGRYLSECPVIVDTCNEHGIWLDDGELGRLMDFLGESVGAKKGSDDSMTTRLKRFPNQLFGALERMLGVQK